MKRRDFIRLTGIGTLGLLFSGCGIAKGAQVKLPGLVLSGKRVQQETERVRPRVKEWLKNLGMAGAK